jgi:hypothetical protein
MIIAKILLCVWLGVGLLLAAHNHGKPRDGVNNFWFNPLSAAIALWLLWCGGFFV